MRNQNQKLLVVLEGMDSHECYSKCHECTNEESYIFIGLCMEVHNNPEPGYLEIVIVNATNARMKCPIRAFVAKKIIA